MEAVEFGVGPRLSVGLAHALLAGFLHHPVTRRLNVRLPGREPLEPLRYPQDVDFRVRAWIRRA